ncbi:phage terminase large subunit family protein [Rubrivivax sp. JA1026]|uniref:phage terminase large subunit family protein n=1 Tax=Rubrivivax sp. JA1026 TaxID=2710888 RepID=UPI0013E95153|nr:terminase gpA endonuclease subunit [Rubrivivax sp. JA1026]
MPPALTLELQAAIGLAARRGLEALAAPEPMRVSEWAAKHYYLSAESSYVEQRWQAWPFQTAILDCMGHDDIRSVTVRKSARIGYTKMLGAALGYFAQHKRRNQVVYQPTDEDAEDWCKTELDTMLRDVGVMSKIFPAFMRRSKDNTLRQKTFLGSKLYIRGGKAAKNYRRLTVDVVVLDEVDGFDRDIEREGSPTRLSAKRLEGALFPKHIKGSTPKLAGHSLTDEEHDAAALQMRFCVPCPTCSHEQPLEWGGKDVRFGFKWSVGDASTVVHMCSGCGVGFTQGEYLAVWHRGRWVSRDGGVYIDAECRFRRTVDDVEVPAPVSIGFSIWTAYSPQATWQAIVEEFLAARELQKRGDHTAMKTWTNTTLGQSFKFEGAKTSADVLIARAKGETYRLRLVPRAGLVLAAGVDVQDNRLEAVVWAAGRDDERWCIDYRVIWGSPGLWTTWMGLDAYLATRWPHEGGQSLALDGVGIDTQGHFTHQVYRYCMLRQARRVYATRGSTLDGQPIVAGAPRAMDVNVDDRIVKAGVKLWHIGTGTAKDLIHSRLQIIAPGPGYMHMCAELPDVFFGQLTSEERVQQRTARGLVWRWQKPTEATRNEVLDCTVGAEFVFARMKLHQYTDAEWSRLERALCPPADLFSGAAPVVEPLPPPAEMPEPPPRLEDIRVASEEDTMQASAPRAGATPIHTQSVPASSPLWAMPRPRRVRGSIT